MKIEVMNGKAEGIGFHWSFETLNPSSSESWFWWVRIHGENFYLDQCFYNFCTKKCSFSLSPTPSLQIWEGKADVSGYLSIGLAPIMRCSNPGVYCWFHCLFMGRLKTSPIYQRFSRVLVANHSCGKEMSDKRGKSRQHLQSWGSGRKQETLIFVKGGYVVFEKGMLTASNLQATHIFSSVLKCIYRIPHPT